MIELGIDIETFSSVDLTSSGKYKYVESPDFEILLFAYKIDNEKTKIIDLANFETLPPSILSALTDPNIIKSAYNAAFEKGCIDKYFGIDSSPWKCTMILAASLGYPLGLDACSKALKLPIEKDRAGKALIKLFSIPPRQFGPEEKWKAFKKYCIQDVEVETTIKNKLKFFPEAETELYLVDQKINTNGINLDEVLINQAISIDAENRINLIAEAREITSLDNPNSTQQLIKWLEKEMPLSIIENLQKKTIPLLITEAEEMDYIGKEQIKRILKIRQELSKSSIKKYQAMIDCRCADGRARGLLQFLGASRTGRWAGRLIQVQNLIKNNLKDLDLARNLIREGDSDMVELLFGSISNTLSQLIRTAFIPSPGNKFIITDFSAIEARVISWLANEKWRMDVFAGDGRIYEAAAVAMFRVPIEEVTKESKIRFTAKCAELSLGFQGALGAFQRLGGADLGLTEKEIMDIVAKWREANPKIVKLWHDVQNKVLNCIDIGEPQNLKFLSFKMSNKHLFVKLPSGRSLAYANPKKSENKWGNVSMTYESQNQITGQWETTESYGGKFVENIVQATARDLLAAKIVEIYKAGYKIVMHVHDEIIIDAPKNTDKKAIDDIMCLPIAWAPGLPLRADTTECNYYRKD